MFSSLLLSMSKLPILSVTSAPVLQRSWVQIPNRAEFLSSLIFTNAQVLFISVKIAFLFRSLSAVQ